MQRYGNLRVSFGFRFFSTQFHGFGLKKKKYILYIYMYILFLVRKSETGFGKKKRKLVRFVNSKNVFEKKTFFAVTKQYTILKMKK